LFQHGFENVRCGGVGAEALEKNDGSYNSPCGIEAKERPMFFELGGDHFVADSV
jgi:hypothetical protein